MVFNVRYRNETCHFNTFSIAKLSFTLEHSLLLSLSHLAFLGILSILSAALCQETVYTNITMKLEACIESYVFVAH